MFSHSCQWFWYAQSLENNSQAGCMSFLSVVCINLICSNTAYILDACSTILISGSHLLEEWLTRWMHVQPDSSVVLICLNTEEWLTNWTHVQPFLSVVLICSNTGEQLTRWMHVKPSHQQFISAQTLESNSHSGCMCSAILVSSSDLLRHWRETHSLDMCSAIHQWLSSAQTLKSNSLPGCTFSHSCLICSKTGERLTFTFWMHVQPFSSMVLICSNTGERLTR